MYAAPSQQTQSPLLGAKQTSQFRLRGLNKVSLQKAIQLIRYNCSDTRTVKMRPDLRGQ